MVRVGSTKTFSYGNMLKVDLGMIEMNMIKPLPNSIIILSVIRNI